MERQQLADLWGHSRASAVGGRPAQRSALGGQSLSQAMQLNPLLQGILDISQLANIQMVYHGAKRQLHLGLTARPSLVNNRRLVFDHTRTTQPRARLSERDRPVSLWLRRDAQRRERLMMGDDVGQVWTLDTEQRSKGGLGYEGRFLTNHTDFAFADASLASKRKNGQFLELTIEGKGPHPLTVNWYWDGILGGTKAFPMGQAGHPSLIHVRRRITGSGYTFAMEDVNSGVGQDFPIARAVVSFTVSDERVSRAITSTTNDEFLRTSYVILRDANGGLWYGFMDTTGELALRPVDGWPPGGTRLNPELWSWLQRVSPDLTVWYLSPDTNPAGGWIVSTIQPSGLGSSDEGLVWTSPDGLMWTIDLENSGEIALTSE
jgi:hypothetical protein